MNPSNHIPKKIIEAPPDGLGGPRWVVRLEDGTSVIGRPSWIGNSGPVALPDATQPMSDWRRLKDRCEETGVRLVSLALWVPTFGWFHAPEGKGSYGYWEDHVRAMHIGKGNHPASFRSGCQALCICWPDKKEGRSVILVKKVFATGVYEEWVRLNWLPCIIGSPEAQQAFKDEGVLAKRFIQ